MTQDDFVANDANDRQRTFMVVSGLAAAALGIDDPGAVIADGGGFYTSTPGQHQILSVTSGTTPQGQAAVTANIAGTHITLPMIIVGAGLLWLVLRK